MASGARGSGHRFAPTGLVHQVDSSAEGKVLAEFLLNPERTLPVVVLTIPPNAAVPLVDPGAVAEELKDVAPVVLAQPAATFGLTDGLGDRTLSVFYGAARIYPPGRAWLRDINQAPLHFMQTRAQGAKVAKRLVTEALNHAYAAGALAPPAVEPDDRPATATVRKALNDVQVLLTTDAGTQALMQAVHLFPEVPAPSLVRPGQVLSGVRRPMGLMDEFIPHAVVDDPAGRVHEAYSDGTVTIARVARVERSRARLLLHPLVAVELTADADEDLRHLLTDQDVVAVEVAWVDDDWLVVLADDEAAGSSLPVLPGGPPWLTLADLASSERQVEAEAVEATPHAGRSAPGAAASREELTAELDQAMGMVEQLGSELDGAADQIATLRAELRMVKSDLRRSRRSARLEQLPQVYSDPVRQLRFEIELAYLMRLDESTREQFPMPTDYVVGSRFVATLQSLEGISRSKVIDVVAETLCGVANTQPGRELHQWRDGKSGGQLTRHDGARAWRVSLQVKSASARRLKFWRLPDGRIELDSVGVHDDGLA